MEFKPQHMDTKRVANHMNAKYWDGDDNCAGRLAFELPFRVQRLGCIPNCTGTYPW
jgi:hypothetical protein